MNRLRLSRLGGSLYSLIVRETFVLQAATLGCPLRLAWQGVSGKGSAAAEAARP